LAIKNSTIVGEIPAKIYGGAVENKAF